MSIPQSFRTLLAWSLLASVGFSQNAPEKPKPDSRFGNWLYKRPDPKVWKQKNSVEGDLVFEVELPDGDWCMLSLSVGAAAEADFGKQFSDAVDVDQHRKGLVEVKVDSGAKASKSKEGFDVLTRSMTCVNNTRHTMTMYVGGHSGNRFELAQFSTTGEETWKQHGADASEFLNSLKLANSMDPAEVEKLVGKAPVEGAKPPELPGFGDAGQAPAKPPNDSAIVNKGKDGPALEGKDGTPTDGVKISRHDVEMYSPCIKVAPDGTIHVAFVEVQKHDFRLAVYHSSSADGGKTWTEPKNLSEDTPSWRVGNCGLVVDSQSRAYVIWRVGIREDVAAELKPGGIGLYNLVYRVLSGGTWSKVVPVHPTGDEKNHNGSNSWFACVDPAGHVQVVWNTTPFETHKECRSATGAFTAAIGNGLVMQTTLNGPDPGQPREIYLARIDQGDPNRGVAKRCDDFGALEGYVDGAGQAHFITRVIDLSTAVRHTVIQLIEGGKQIPAFELPGEFMQTWTNPPQLLLDAQGRRHVIALHQGGEKPSVRDYLLGSDAEPTVIRSAAPVNGSAGGFQAYQGPGGRMIAIMQMNDVGMQGDMDSYVSTSDGGKWSEPINMTNNAGRQAFSATHTGRADVLAVVSAYTAGPAAATFDREGKLLVVMINEEHGGAVEVSLGVAHGGHTTSIPALRFLKF